MKTLLKTDARIEGRQYSPSRIGSTTRRRACEQADLQVIENMIQREAAAEEREEFMQKLRPLLRYVGNHARRELRLMEAYGKLSPGQVLFEDLLDELVARAWTHYPERPQWIEFDLWLTKIAGAILEEQVSQSA